MPMRLNLGVSRKLGTPDYGSVGASCGVELELDAGMLDRDRAGFEARVRDAYLAAEKAVQSELERLRPPPASATPRDRAAPAAPRPESPGDRPGSPPRGRFEPRPATPNQLRAIRSLAGRLRLDLPALLREEHGLSRPEDLSLSQASGLIDALKERNGD